MEKSNLIISIIIVVCVAAAVAAYGLTNSDNAIFSNFGGVDSGDGGPGLNISNLSGNSEQNGFSSGSSGSGSSGSGSGSSGSGSSGSGGGHSSQITSTQAKKIVNDHILEPGYYAGEPVKKSSYYYVPILNSSGENSGYMLVSFTGKIIEGAGG